MRRAGRPAAAARGAPAAPAMARVHRPRGGGARAAAGRGGLGAAGAPAGGRSSGGAGGAAEGRSLPGQQGGLLGAGPLGPLLQGPAGAGAAALQGPPLRRAGAMALGDGGGGGPKGSALKKAAGAGQALEEFDWSKMTATGGGGGGLGRRGFIGGGGGGGDDGDDDRYQDEPEDEGAGEGADAGIFTFTGDIPELFDLVTLQAVLAEWGKTITTLPGGLKAAVDLKLLSSSQLVGFLETEYRPHLGRTLLRRLPGPVSQALSGRLLADPAFLFKVALEQALTVGLSVRHELKTRGDAFREELDFVALNTLSLCAANAAMVWLMAPARVYGSLSKNQLAHALTALPNHVFDKSGALRRYSPTSRGAGLLIKSLQLGLVGAGAGAASAVGNRALLAANQARDPEYDTSVAIPDVATNAAGLGLFLASTANLRYQLLGGAERALAECCGSMGLRLGALSVLRVVNQAVGEPTRVHLMGLEYEDAEDDEDAEEP